MNNLLNYAIDRLGENSTWRGLALILTSSGIMAQPEHANAIAALGLAVVGVINIFRKQPAAK